MQIKGIEGLSLTEVNMEVQNGGRFVIYQYCVSVIILTFKRSSAIYFIRADEHAGLKSMQYTALSLIAGWWGIPWGPIYTVSSTVKNLSGGTNVTQSVIASLNSRSN
jgi:hypothetical protein